jgi:predicted alpha/beta superfamily hydrolase
MIDQPERAVASPVCLPRTEAWTLAAQDGLLYQVFMAWPEVAAPPAGYPVIYLLDANALFATVVETIRMRSRRPDVTGVEAAVVVGIGYPAADPQARARRIFDYTPGPAVGEPEEEGRPQGDTGGAERFLAWIERDLKPDVEARLPIDRSRQTLLGHSLGGYLALDALLAAPGAFQRYVAASPSLWWDEARLRRRLPAFGRWLAEAPRDLRVMLTAGEFEQSLAPGEAEGPRARLTEARRTSRRMIDRARDLAADLAVLPAAGDVRVTFELFAEADHASSVLRTIDRCLRFVLAP